MTCPNCEYHKNRAARWRAEAYKLIGHEIELPWVGLEPKDMPNEENSMYDHPFFIAGMVWAANKLKEKNT